MATTVRAAISIVMLAGFYVLALGLVGGLIAACLWIAKDHPGALAVKVGIVAVLLAVGLVRALWKAARARPAPPAGLVVSRQRTPQLWSTVDELAAVVGTRAPDEIRLLPEVNAAVMEEAKLLGLIGGRRTMFIGVPLLQAFTVAQLRSVLAHELGHYSQSHTRLGALAHRGRMVIVASVQHTSGVAGWLLRQYAKLYLLVEQAVSRKLEFEADQASVRVAGRASATSALRELPVLDAAWGFYLSRYVGPGWERGLAPDDVLGGFRRLLHGRSDQLAKLRAEAPDEEASRWDSHPPIGDRIAAIERQPDPGVVADNRPATALIAGFEELVARLEAEALNREGKQVLGWDEFTAAAVMAAGVQPVADALFRAAARLTGRDQGDLGMVLDVIAAGRAGELARTLAPHADPEEAAEALRDAVESAFTAAAVASGVARWRHSWTGPAELVDRRGERLDVATPARLAMEAGTVEQAGRWLATFGVDAAAARQVSDGVDLVSARVVGGLANMDTSDGYVDVFILGNGLLLIPGPKSTDNGRRRLLEILDSAPIQELADRYQFLPYDEIATAAIVKQTPVRVELTLHSGERIRLSHGWTGEQLTKDSDDLLRSAVAPFVPAPAS
ncbi:MAG TPA: M48 family metalloprotease [Micromonosporaceae bacterium]|nr:M48 family metalloprotease [Micromonosporaceae bacterium]